MKLGLFTHDDQNSPPPGKAFWQAQDGTLAKAVNGSLIRSRYQTCDVSTLAELAEWMQSGAQSSQHMTAGIAKHPEAVAVPKDQLATTPINGQPIIARSNDYLDFTPEAGLMCIDSDGTGTFDDIWAALVGTVPALGIYAALHASSTSSNVTLGDVQTGLRGAHTFFHVKDATDIPRALTALHERQMLRGYPRHKLSSSGAFLPRSWVDQALRVPSQPIYLRAAVVPPVVQHKQVLLRAGVEVLDTAAIIPDLTPEERTELATKLTEAETALKPQMAEQRDRYVSQQAKAVADGHGVDEQTARATIESALQSRILMPDFVLYVGKQAVTVRELFEDPAQWNGVACCDPLEPDYNGGRTVAKIYMDGSMSGRVHSFAHSGGDKGTVYPMYNMPPASEAARVAAMPAVAESGWTNIQPSPFPTSDKPDTSNDAMAAELGQLLFNDNARFWTERDKWLLWDGHRWVPDDKMRSWDAVRVFMRTKAEQAKTWAWQAASTARDERTAKQLIAWGDQIARDLRQAATIAAVHRMMSWSGKGAVVVGDLNTDLMLLGTPQGTVDLRTGLLRPAKRSDLITQQTAVVPAPAGTPAPLWEKFLLEVMDGDAELVAFLKRACGYALTGSVQEQVFLFMTGGGRNGKGVFLNTLLDVMGDYACKAPANLFIETRNQEHSTGVAGLIGKRFVFGSEIPQGAFWNETALKDMTGGDMLRARFMRQDYFDFMPQFLLAIAANSKPALRETGQAIRDRLRLVPFDVYFPPEKRDNKLPEKLRAEWPAILRWMIDGCLEWQAIGLKPPEKVMEASTVYMDNEDMLGLFIADNCTVNHADAHCGASCDAFVKAYNLWRVNEGLQTLPKVKVTKELEQRGFRKAKMRVGEMKKADSPVWCFRGLMLAAPVLPPSENVQ